MDNSQSASETAVLTNPGTGPRTYRVVVVNWLTVTPIQTANGVVTFNLVEPEPHAAAPGAHAAAHAPRFSNYKPPSGLGEHAGEPTLGVNFATGNVMYIALLETLARELRRQLVAGQGALVQQELPHDRPQNQRPDPVHRLRDRPDVRLAADLPEQAQPVRVHERRRRDVESEPGRGHQLRRRSPDDRRRTICRRARRRSIPAIRTRCITPRRTSRVAEFATSLDGGRTYGPAVPMFSIADCAGLHGHIKVSAGGRDRLRAAWQLRRDGDGRWSAGRSRLSPDSGLTWSVVRVPSSKASTWDPSVGVGKAGTVYFGYGDNGDRIPRVAVSRDKGRTWTVGPDLGAAHSIKRIAFPAMVAGDDDRAAFAFLGTAQRRRSARQRRGFRGHVAVVRLHDLRRRSDVGHCQRDRRRPGPARQRLRRRASVVRRSPDTRNLLDFMDVQIDAPRAHPGRAMPTAASALPASPARTRTATASWTRATTTRADKAAIARQSGGLGLFAEFDPAGARRARAAAADGRAARAVGVPRVVAPG